MAAKIPVNLILSDFERMLSEHWAYDWSGTSYGKVSCAGAFVWAFQQHGVHISHGSNYMAREEAVQLLPIGQVSLVPGMAAFKCHKPGDQGYALPDKYRMGGRGCTGDLNDYYHVGLVSEDVTQVLNAQGSATEFVSSPISKGWTHVVLLKRVDYDAAPSSTVEPEPGEPGVSGTAVVWAENGGSVKLRQKTSATCRLYWEVPCGSLVTVRGQASGDWLPVAWNGHIGFMMSKYLRVDEPSASTPVPSPEADTSWAAELYDLTKEQAEALRQAFPSAHIFQTVG